MKKKIVLLIICGLMTVTLFGCASKQNSANQSDQKTEDTVDIEQNGNAENDNDNSSLEGDNFATNGNNSPSEADKSDSDLNSDEFIIENLKKDVKRCVEDYYHDNYYLGNSANLVDEDDDEYITDDGELLFWLDYYKAYIKFEDIKLDKDNHSAFVSCRCTLYKNDGTGQVDVIAHRFVADENNMNWHLDEAEITNGNGTSGSETDVNAGDIYDVAVQNLREGIAPDGRSSFDDYKEEVWYIICDYDGDGFDDILVHWLTDISRANEYCMIYLYNDNSFVLNDAVPFEEVANLDWIILLPEGTIKTLWD